MREGMLFGNENVLEHEDIIHLYEEMTLAKGEGLIAQGELTTAFYIVKSGELEVVEGTGGNAITLARLIDGDVFGEVSFFDGGERSATVRASGRTTVYAMSRENFMQVVEHEPELALRMLVALGRVSAGKMRRADRMLSGMAGKSDLSDAPAIRKLVADIRKTMR
jgi:CRP-like cAMP-binding protein